MIPPATIREGLKKIIGQKRFDEVTSVSGPIKSDLIFEAETSYEDASNIHRELDELFLNLEEETLRDELTDVLQKLHKAEENKASGEIANILKACQDISAKIAALKNRR